MNNKKIIIGIIGEIAAGKTTLTEYLQTKFSADTARFSDSLRDILDRAYLPQTRYNLQTISRTLRENFGQDMISKIMNQDIANKTAEIIITEGIRRPSDITSLQADYKDNFYIIYIKTDERTRYERLVSRSENPDDQQKTWEEFQVEGQREAESAISEIAKTANFAIDNNGTEQDMYTQVDKIVAELIEKL